jgi:hypothetical protein
MQLQRLAWSYPCYRIMQSSSVCGTALRHPAATYSTLHQGMLPSCSAGPRRRGSQSMSNYPACHSAPSCSCDSWWPAPARPRLDQALPHGTDALPHQLMLITAEPMLYPIHLPFHAHTSRIVTGAPPLCDRSYSHTWRRATPSASTSPTCPPAPGSGGPSCAGGQPPYPPWRPPSWAPSTSPSQRAAAPPP